MDKNDSILSLQQFAQYKPLLRELVMRDLRVKYRRSFLGYLWSLLSPLMMMTVMSVVFSYMFRFDIPNYPLYLICGQTLWTFFAESTSISLTSIWSNGVLIRKVYIPKYIFPISKSLSCFVTTSFSLVAILIVMLFTKVPFTAGLLLTIVPLLLLLLFSMGLGLILSALSVFFRDIVHIYSVVLMAWMYLTPIFYPISALPDNLAHMISFNPMYHYVDFFRQLVLTGTLPSVYTVCVCAFWSIFSMVLGLGIFHHFQKSFILYV